MKNYKDYVNHSRKITDLHMSMAVLGWDQETKMPKNGSKFRSQQLSTLAEISHKLSIDNDYGNLLLKLSNDNSLDKDQSRNIELSLKKFIFSFKSLHMLSNTFYILKTKFYPISFLKSKFYLLMIFNKKQFI